jgi:hypothetical protein
VVFPELGLPKSTSPDSCAQSQEKGEDSNSPKHLRLRAELKTFWI